MENSIELLHQAEFGSCIIEVTATIGLEEIAKEECEEKLGVKAHSRPGRVTFPIKIDELSSLYKLRSIERFGVVIGTKTFQFTDKKNSNLNELKEFVHCLDWKNGISVWKNVKQFAELSENIRFRVSCNRHGDDHNFDSLTAASDFGSEINEKFKWKVDLENYDFEILLHIYGKDVCVAIALTKSSLFRRNITHFGFTTLKSTIAHSMLRLSEIKSSDLLCDPMCGSGSIPIEGKISWPTTHMLCGDMCSKEIQRTKKNIDVLNLRKKVLDIELFQWDATRLPLENERLNAIITDLPFGKRLGSKKINKHLYPKVFYEFARVLDPRNGRAVIITADTVNFEAAMLTTKTFFNVDKKLSIIIGGINANIFVILRKCIRFK